MAAQSSGAASGPAAASPSALAQALLAVPAGATNFCCALTAGAFATFVTQPADLIRTQLQLAVRSNVLNRIQPPGAGYLLVPVRQQRPLSMSRQGDALRLCRGFMLFQLITAAAIALLPFRLSRPCRG